MNLKITIVKEKDGLYFCYKNKAIKIAPDELTELSLSPTTQNFDNFIRNYIKENINQFQVEVQDEWFFFCDACLIFDSNYLNGWLYKIKSEKVKVPYTHVWFCSYAGIIFDNPPNILYLKVE